MDPNLFHVDWERTLEASTTIAIVAFLIERARSIPFESRALLPLYVATPITRRRGSGPTAPRPLRPRVTDGVAS